MHWILAGTHSLDSVLRVSNYYVARGLAARREKTLYLPAPVSPYHYLLRRSDERFRERRPYHDDKPVVFEDYLQQYTPMTMLPVLNRFPFNRRWSLERSLSWTFPSLQRVVSEWAGWSPDVLVVSNPQYACLDQLVHPRRLIYRCVDDISGFQDIPRSLIDGERRLLERCDLVTAPGERQAEVLRERGAKDVRVIPHGVEVERFQGEFDEPDDLLTIPRPRIVYVGSINERFNREWLRHAAREYPHYSFVMIGPVEFGNSSLPELPNVFPIGPRSPETIPAYLRHCDAAIIPFRLSQLVQATCPIKLYEYLAAGLHVVATRWKDLEDRDAPIDLAEDAESFAAALDDLKNTPKERIRRTEFARSCSWERSNEAFFQAVSDVDQQQSPTALRAFSKSGRRPSHIERKTQ